MVDGTGKDIFAILKEHKFNYIRLRIFHDPRATNGYSRNGFCDLEHTKQMGKRIKAAGLGFLLDFHYSDNWADPGKQTKPAAWRTLSFEELAAAVRKHTRDTLQALKEQNTTPDMVQVGNEISNGLLWPDGSIKNLDRFAALFKAGAKGVKDVDVHIPVVLHLAWGGQNAQSRWLLDNALARGMEFDIIGQSYYPKWHGTTNDLRSNLNDLARRYRQPIMVVEYSEHKRVVNDIVQALPDGKGLGTFIWEPTQWGEALFDGKGNAKPELDLYPQMSRDYEKKIK